MTQNERKLLNQIKKLSIDPIWNCLTRSALQIRWTELTQDATGLIYIDVDKMHDLNEKYTHAGVDKKIKTVLKNIRQNDIISSRWLNGDEITLILKSGNPAEFSLRLIQEFKNVGIGITCAYTHEIKKSPEKTINPLDKKVQISKNNNVRGILVK